MLRKIIKINKEKCVGCKLCVNACQEGAIGIIDGKATLMREDYCDGLGNCLPVCPTGAISFEEREAPAFDKQAVEMHKAKTTPCACPGSSAKVIEKTEPAQSQETKAQTMLNQWPVQIKLVPVNAQ